MRVMAQGIADQNIGYLPNVKNLSCRCIEKCRQIVVMLVIPQSKKYMILSIKIYRQKLAPHINRGSSCIGHEVIKIHKKQNWLKRCSSTVIDNAAGLGMAMLSRAFLTATVIQS